MNKWVMKINRDVLRDAINDSDYELILKEIMRLSKEIMDNYPNGEETPLPRGFFNRDEFKLWLSDKNGVDWEFNDIFYNAEGDLQILEEEDEEELSEIYCYEDFEDMVDCRLYDFYGACDRHHVWLEL